MRFKGKWLVMVVVVLLLLGIGLTAWLSRPSAPSVPVVFLTPQQLQAKPAFWRRLVPRAAWLWLWRLKTTLAGTPRVVDLSASALELAEWSEAQENSRLAAKVLGQPDLAGTNGLQVWLLDEARLKALQQELSRVPGFTGHQSRITTADGSEAMIFMGSSVSVGGVTNQVGLAALFLPRVRDNLLDLTTAMSFSEAVPSVPAVRLRLPADGGAFLLQTNPTETRYYGFLLSARLPPKGK